MRGRSTGTTWARLALLLTLVTLLAVPLLAVPATAGAQSGSGYSNPQLSGSKLRAAIRQYTRYARIVERLERCNYFRLQRLLRGAQARSCRRLSRQYRLRQITRVRNRVPRGFSGGEVFQGEFVQLVCLMRRGCVRYPQGLNDPPPRTVPADNGPSSTAPTPVDPPPGP